MPSRNILTPSLISLSKKDSPLAPSMRNKGKLGLIRTTDTPQIRNWKILGVWIIVLSFTLPVFRSGGRVNLTFWNWLRNHTIYGPKVEYVPEEDYAAEMRDI